MVAANQDPKVVIVLALNIDLGFLIPLGEAIAGMGANVSYLSTDYVIEKGARKLGHDASNVMTTHLPARTETGPRTEGLDMEDVCSHVLRQPDAGVSRERMLQEAGRVVEAYGAHFDRLCPDIVIAWNGTIPRVRAAMRLAEARGYKTVYFEQGNFPGTVICDPKGVNWEGSLMDFELPREFDRERIEKYLEGYRARADMPVRPGDATQISQSIRQALLNFVARRNPFHPRHYLTYDIRVSPHNLIRRLKRYCRLRFAVNKQPEAAFEPGRPYIFLPLQVHDDTQITVNSPYIRTMEQLVELMVDARPTEAELVVKTHPADVDRRSYERIAMMMKRPGCTFLTQGNSLKLVRESTCVVTVNSTVGLEALAFMKPVVVLGNAVYAGRGLTFDVKDPHDLPAKLSEALHGSVDQDEVLRFLDYFIFEYSRPCDFRKPQRPQLEALARFILGGCKPERP
jgi:capsular polysaccharide export protein